MGNRIFLYHGSDREVFKPLCNKGIRFRDFGQCFYTTYDSRTATDWAKKNFLGNGVLNKYSINLEDLVDGALIIKRFNADAEWAEFVYNNRFVEKFKRPKYDIIIGPIADKGLKDQFLKIKTEKKTFAEIAPLIHYDKYKSLQVAFCTEYAVSMLNFI